jgi:hypothetical protein
VSTFEGKIAEAITSLVRCHVDPTTLVLPDYIKEGRVRWCSILADLYHDYDGENAGRQVEAVLNSVLMEHRIHGTWPIAVLSVHIYDLTYWINVIPGKERV